MENNYQQGIVERVFALRDTKSLTNSQFEQVVGLPNSSLNAWKTGKAKPSLDSLMKISLYFNVSMDYLAFGKLQNTVQSYVPATCVATPHLVAYFDILGTKEIMKKADYVKVYQDIYDDLTTPNDVFALMVKKYEELHPEFSTSDIKTKIYTDNIVCYMPYEEQTLNISIVKFFYFIANLQSKLLKKHRILIRGGIANGELYADDVFILGKALIEAYNLEENVANYPRIVLSDSLTDFIYKNNFYKQELLDNGMHIIEKDTDEELFVNFLTSNNNSQNEEIKKIIAEEMNKLIMANEPHRAIQKWKWLYRYHNDKIYNYTANSNNKTATTTDNGNVSINVNNSTLQSSPISVNGVSVDGSISSDICDLTPDQLEALKNFINKLKNDDNGES